MDPTQCKAISPPAEQVRQPGKRLADQPSVDSNKKQAISSRPSAEHNQQNCLVTSAQQRGQPVARKRRARRKSKPLAATDPCRSLLSLLHSMPTLLSHCDDQLTQQGAAVLVALPADSGLQDTALQLLYKIAAAAGRLQGRATKTAQDLSKAMADPSAPKQIDEQQQAAAPPPPIAKQGQQQRQQQQQARQQQQHQQRQQQQLQYQQHQQHQQHQYAVQSHQCTANKLPAINPLVAQPLAAQPASKHMQEAAALVQPADGRGSSNTPGVQQQMAAPQQLAVKQHPSRQAVPSFQKAPVTQQAGCRQQNTERSLQQHQSQQQRQKQQQQLPQQSTAGTRQTADSFQVDAQLGQAGAYGVLWVVDKQPVAFRWSMHEPAAAAAAGAATAGLKASGPDDKHPAAKQPKSQGAIAAGSMDDNTDSTSSSSGGNASGSSDDDITSGSSSSSSSDSDSSSSEGTSSSSSSLHDSSSGDNKDPAGATTGSDPPKAASRHSEAAREALRKLMASKAGQQQQQQQYRSWSSTITQQAQAVQHGSTAPVKLATSDKLMPQQQQQHIRCAIKVQNDSGTDCKSSAAVDAVAASSNIIIGATQGQQRLQYGTGVQQAFAGRQRQVPPPAAAAASPAQEVSAPVTPAVEAECRICRQLLPASLILQTKHVRFCKVCYAAAANGSTKHLAHCPKLNCDAAQVLLGPKGWHSSSGSGKDHYIIVDAKAGSFKTSYTKPTRGLKLRKSITKKTNKNKS